MTWAIYRPDEKSYKKSTEQNGIELSINENTKIPQIYTLPQFLSMSEKIVEFTDSTHIIYWPEYVIYRPDFHNLQTRKIWDGTNNTNRTFHK